MATNLRLTTAGRTAILDDDNTGTAAVTITKLALGAGSGTGGAADDARTTLRDQRDIVAVSGASDEAAGQIAVLAEFDSAGSYAATELGLFAKIGRDGAEFLFAYWTDGGTAFINKPANLRTFVAATVSIVNSEADVKVTVSAKVTLGTVGALTDLTDAPSSYVNAARRKVAVNAAGNAVEFVSGLLPSEITAVTALITAALAGYATQAWVRARGYRTGVQVTAAIAAALAGYATQTWVTARGYRTASQVNEAIAAKLGGITGQRTGKSANYTVVAGDNGKTVEVDASGGARTILLPNLGAGNNGFTVTVIKTDSSANAVTIDGNAADKINGASTYVLKARWEAAILKWTGSAWISIGGASTSWLRDFFGGASSREFTAAGTQNYTWEWGASKCLAVIDGAGGGGGCGGNGWGGGGGGAGDRKVVLITGLSRESVLTIKIGAGGAGGIRGGRSNGGQGGGGLSAGNHGGQGGGDSSVAVSGDTYTAGGGSGGGGGNLTSGGEKSPNGIKRYGQSRQVFSLGGSGGGGASLAEGADSSAGTGGASGAATSAGGAGDNGANGSTASGGDGGDAGRNSDGNGGAGGNGRVILYPLF